MFRGSIPALVTPFRDERFDEAAFRDFVDWQVGQGSHGLVPVGTTGESATLSAQEHGRVVRACVEAAAGRVPVIAGCGSNNTAVAIELVKAAADAGADAALLVPPYYNRPNQEGIYAHFEAVAAATDLPIVLYNVPARTVTDISVETMGRLAKLPSIKAVKDATGNVARVTAQRLACGKDFVQLSGNDDMALGFMAMGGSGCVSVTANVAPRLCAEMHKAWREGRIAEAQAIQDRLVPLHDSLFVETSPAPVKYAASLLGKGSDKCRLPLAPVSEPVRKRVRDAMVTAGLLN